MHGRVTKNELAPDDAVFRSHAHAAPMLPRLVRIEPAFFAIDASGGASAVPSPPGVHDMDGTLVWSRDGSLAVFRRAIAHGPSTPADENPVDYFLVLVDRTGHELGTVASHGDVALSPSGTKLAHQTMQRTRIGAPAPPVRIHDRTGALLRGLSLNAYAFAWFDDDRIVAWNVVQSGDASMVLVGENGKEEWRVPVASRSDEAEALRYPLSVLPGGYVVTHYETWPGRQTIDGPNGTMARVGSRHRVVAFDSKGRTRFDRSWPVAALDVESLGDVATVLAGRSYLGVVTCLNSPDGRQRVMLTIHDLDAGREIANLDLAAELPGDDWEIRHAAGTRDDMIWIEFMRRPWKLPDPPWTQEDSVLLVVDARTRSVTAYSFPTQGFHPPEISEDGTRALLASELGAFVYRLEKD